MGNICKSVAFSFATVWFVFDLYYRVSVIVPFKTIPLSLHLCSVNPSSSSIVRPKSHPPIKLFLLWLHIPKTGTSFANTLLQWGCQTAKTCALVVPEKGRPQHLQVAFKTSMSWDWLSRSPRGRTWLLQNCRNRLAILRNHSDGSPHRPSHTFNMHRAMKLSEAHFTVALFRQPRQRTYSNYLHLSFRYNETNPDKHLNTSLLEFARKPQYMSQQAKLLLGRHYRHREKVTITDAHRGAKLVVNILPFVGLTEEFRLSVRLFHAVFGGIPDPTQFENIRPSILRHRNPNRKRSSFRYDETKFGTWRDDADEIVYLAAYYRFWRDVCRLRTEIESDGFGFVFHPLCYVPLYTG